MTNSKMKMNSKITMVMSASLKDLKGQIGDRSSWRRSIYTVTKSDTDVMALNHKKEDGIKRQKVNQPSCTGIGNYGPFTMCGVQLPEFLSQLAQEF